MKESQIQRAILWEFGERLGFWIWRQNTGAAKRGRQVIHYGLPGQADISGTLPGGRRLEIEVKSATGRQSADQKNFQRKCDKVGALYILARSVEDVRRVLRREGYLDSDGERYPLDYFRRIRPEGTPRGQC